MITESGLVALMMNSPAPNARAMFIYGLVTGMIGFYNGINMNDTENYAKDDLLEAIETTVDENVEELILALEDESKD